ncbi:unnamed protein product, partial [Dovyalis caffra]
PQHTTPIAPLSPNNNTQVLGTPGVQRTPTYRCLRAHFLQANVHAQPSAGHNVHAPLQVPRPFEPRHTPAHLAPHLRQALLSHEATHA